MQVRLARELTGLRVVDDDDVDLAHGVPHPFGHGVDPVVHRVERDQLRARDLLAHLDLQVRLDVAEEDEARRPRRIGELRLEVGEDVELRVERVRGVEIEVVAPAPEEGAAGGDDFQIVRVDLVLAEDAELVSPEVAADDADDPHVREEARREREVRGRAAEHPLALAERGFHRVERDGADDEK
jgi:hypothetical protein